MSETECSVCDKKIFVDCDDVPIFALCEKCNQERKKAQFDQPTIETTIYDYIEVNGRISKKLFKKVIEPKLDELIKTKSNLTKAIQYPKEGKRLYAPNTTNSLVDEFLKGYGERKMKSDFWHNKEPVCPWCNNKLKDSHELFCRSFSNDGDEMDAVCDNCEKNFKIILNIEYTFDSVSTGCLIHKLKPEYHFNGDLHQYACEHCHETFYDWELPSGKHPKLSEGEFEIVKIEVKNEN